MESGAARTVDLVSQCLISPAITKEAGRMEARREGRGSRGQEKVEMMDVVRKEVFQVIGTVF